MSSKTKGTDPDFINGFHVPTVRAVLDLLSIDTQSEGFYYNKPNDYGVIKCTLFSGKGDPFEKYAGEELKARYVVRGTTGTSKTEYEMRGTGIYKLNEAGVKMVLKKLLPAAHKQSS